MTPRVDELRQRIEARIAELIERRAQYVEKANKDVAAYDAAIGELTAILEPPQENPADDG